MNIIGNSQTHRVEMIDIVQQKQLTHGYNDEGYVSSSKDSLKDK